MILSSRPRQARSHQGVADGDDVGGGDVECEGEGEGDFDGLGELDGEGDRLGELDGEGDAWGVGDSAGEYDDDGDSDGWTGDGPWVARRLTTGDGLALADARLAAEAGAAAGRLEEVRAVG